MNRLDQAERLDRELDQALQRSAHDSVKSLLERIGNLRDAACRRHASLPAPAPGEPPHRTLIRQELVTEIERISALYAHAHGRAMEVQVPQAKTMKGKGPRL